MGRIWVGVLLAAGVLHAEAGFEEQLKRLGSGDPIARRFAARAIAGFMEHRTTTEPYTRALARALRINDPEVREQIGPTLLKAGPEGVPWLVRVFAYSHDDARTYASRALARIGKPALPALEEALGKTTRYRMGAAETLGLMGPDAAPLAPRVLLLLDDRSSKVQRAAALALGRIRAMPERVAPLLVARFEDPDPKLARACMRAAGLLGAPAVPAVLAALQEARPRVVEVLETLVASSLPAFEEVLRSGTVAQRQVVAQVMARHGLRNASESTRRALVAALDDPSVAVRVAATAALVSVPADALVTEALLARRDDSSVNARAWATFALAGRVGVEPFKKGLEDASPDVRAAAGYGAALASRWTRPVVAPLRKLLADHECEFAARGLGRLGRRAAPALDELVAAAEKGNVVAVEALGSLLADRVPGGFAGRAMRFGRAPPELRVSVRRALEWLASAQEKDGRWAAARHGGERGVDVGVTGLALLAFLGAGEGPMEGPRAATVRRGLRYLLELQKKAGAFRDGRRRYEVLQHAIATLAVAEAWGITGSPEFRAPTVRAVAYLEHARNPYLAWRYKPRSGKNDTHNTSWAVHALVAADLAGHAPSEDAFVGARVWLERMTDEYTGNVGYNMLGGGSSFLPAPEDAPADDHTRAVPASTAMGHWTARILDIDNPTVRDRGVQWILKSPPAWNDRNRTDFIYWRFGALFLSRKHLMAQRTEAWFGALHLTLLDRQTMDGRWHADGHWGPVGGIVYSTAMGALALLGPFTYPQRFHEKKRLSPAFAEAHAALRRLRESKHEPVRVAAERALRGR